MTTRQYKCFGWGNNIKEEMSDILSNRHHLSMWFFTQRPRLIQIYKFKEKVHLLGKALVLPFYQSRL